MEMYILIMNNPACMCENNLGQHYNAISLAGVGAQAQHGWKVKKLTEKEAHGCIANTQLHKNEAL